MLIGVMFSAVMGGLTAVMWSVLQHHELPRLLAAYPLGGLLAVAAFVSLSLLRAGPMTPQMLPRD